MLRLFYEDECACIDAGGRVEYHEDTISGLIVTEAPSETIQLMVLAVMPLVGAEAMKAEIMIEKLWADMRVVTEDVVNADSAESKAKLAGLSARSARVELSAQLKKAEGTLQLARVFGTPQSSQPTREADIM